MVLFTGDELSGCLSGRWPKAHFILLSVNPKNKSSPDSINWRKYPSLPTYNLVKIPGVADR